MIFGITSPKYIYDRGGAGEVEVLLNHIVLLRSEPETEYVDLQSEIDGFRDSTLRARHWIVEMKVYLYKYADPAQKFADIMAHMGKSVSLWLHRDGDPFLQADGTTDARFTLREVTPIYIETVQYRDGAILLFRSVDPVVLNSGVEGSNVLPQYISKKIKIPAANDENNPVQFETTVGDLDLTAGGGTWPTFSLTTHAITVIPIVAGEKQSCPISVDNNDLEVSGGHLKWKGGHALHGNPDVNGEYWVMFVILSEVKV